MNLSYDLKLAIKAAKKAGKHIKKQFGKHQDISCKGHNDFVTKTDVKAEGIILGILEKTGYSVLSEEKGECIKQASKKWIIDPIDGTTNFIGGFPFFAVSIALMDNDELILGVVNDPISDECYYAEKGNGAYLNGKKIQISQKAGVVLMCHGRSKKSMEEYCSAVNKLMLDKNTPVFNFGSTALMICLVARGSYDAFLCCGDALYDYAGGLIIAKEAGARISDWRGNNWDNSNNYIIVADSELSKIISKEVAGFQVNYE